MIAPIILLDIPPTFLSGTFLRKFANGCSTSFLLPLLILLFPPAEPVVVLFASFALVPCIFVDDAYAEAAFNATKNVTFFPTHVNLSRLAITSSTPAKVRIVTQRASSRQFVEPVVPLAIGSIKGSCNLLLIDLRSRVLLHLMMLQNDTAFIPRTPYLVPGLTIQLGLYP